MALNSKKVGDTVMLVRYERLKYVYHGKGRCRICAKDLEGNEVIKVMGFGIDYHLCLHCAREFSEALSDLSKEENHENH